MIEHKKVVLASTIGTLVEFYDFTLYGFFASIIAPLFFPQFDSYVSLIMSYGVFAVSFFARPLGSLIIGIIGDNWGRVRALTLSILFTGIPTILIGLLPTYHQIGIYAPIALVVMRFLQGVCTGGEYNGAFIFAFEHKRSKEGFLGGLITAFAASGMLLAIGTSLLVIRFFPQDYAWRIPFILGGLIAMGGYYIRRYVMESPEFSESRHRAQRVGIKQLYEFSRKSFLPFVLTFWIGAVSGTMFYFQYIFLSGYCVQTLHMSASTVTGINTIIMMFYVLMLPFFGAISDRVGHYVTSMLSTLVCCLVIVPIAFLLQQATSLALIVVQLALSALTASFVAPSHIIMKKAFPTTYRYLGVSLSFSLGMCVFGGTTPMICTWLVHALQAPYAPALYVLFVCAMGFLSLRVAAQQNISIQHAQLAA